MAKVPSLKYLCQDVIISFIEKNNYHPRLINDVCKRVPHLLLERIFKILLERNVMTDVALLAFLIPDRTVLRVNFAIHIRNSTFKQISYNCPCLRYLDFSDCVQVSNSVVRCILQGCSVLSELRLDRCKRITDAAFDSNQSMFEPLVGCLSLESISLQNCPQLTGSVVVTLNKACRKLKYLNLSQCKRIESSAIRQLFEHHQIISLNLSFIDGVSDEAFLLLQYPSLHKISNNMPMMSQTNRSMTTTSVSYSSMTLTSSPLQKLNLGNSNITDSSMFRMKFLSQLTEIGLSWCSGITDQGIIALSSCCPKLQYIDLKSCQITDVAINAVASNCHYLTRLDVSGCMLVTDEGFENLVQSILTSQNGNAINARIRSVSTDNINKTVAKSKGLVSLGIVWCSQLTDTTLTALRKLVSLEELDVSGCSGITSTSVDELRACGVSVKVNDLGSLNEFSPMDEIAQSSNS